MTDDWDGSLADGFSILLGRPLGDFDQDAAYALYYSCSDLAQELFEETFDAGVLARGEIVHPPYPSIPVLGELLEGWDLIAPHWSLDLGRSLFRAGDTGAGAALGLPDLDTGMTGTDLGRHLTERQWAPAKLGGTYPEIDFRVHTDGSLVDAMRAATGTMAGPGEIFETGPVHGVDPVWERALAALPATGVREHLSNLCRDEQTARSDGAYYLGAKDPGLQGSGTVVAAWRFGEGQAWSAVVQL